MRDPFGSRFVPCGSFLVAVLLAACGDGGSGGSSPAPRFVVAAHGRAPFDTSTDIDGVCPGHLDFSIFLEDGGRGWVALEHRVFGTSVFEVTWTGSQGEYDVVAPYVRVSGLFQDDDYYTADVGWEDLSFTVQDADADGTAESGTATATLLCDWEIVLSHQTETYDSSFDLEGPGDAARLELFGDKGMEPMRPFSDTLAVKSSTALLAESIPGDATLLVDGEPFAAMITATGVQGPFAKGLFVDPAGALPFGAEITLDPGSIVDAFGTAAVFDAAPYVTVDDPGPITVNPSFEGTGGWIGLSTTSGSSELDPVDGAKVAWLGGAYSSVRELFGYFDVPESASEISVSVAVEEYLEGCDYAGSSFSLFTSKGSRSLWPDVPDDPECEDFPYGCTIPWTRMTADLSDVRGERVFLRARSARFTECRPDVYDTLYIDDVRIE